MVDAVLRAIKERTSIQVGRLQSSTTYHGIFIGASKSNCQPKPSWAFTAWHRAESSARGRSRDTNIENFVSLAVEMIDGGAQCTPRLTTKNWMNGLCFYDGYVESKVVFLWPFVMRDSCFGGGERRSVKSFFQLFNFF